MEKQKHFMALLNSKNDSLYIYIWIKGVLSPQDIRDKIMNPESDFQKSMVLDLDYVICHMVLNYLEFRACSVTRVDLTCL